MPGYVTHYIFGRDMYEKLNDPVLKNNLYKNRAVYALGLYRWQSRKIRGS